MNDTTEVDNDKQDRATYKVPLVGHGTIYVEADSPKNAVQVAQNHATPRDLRVEFDVNHHEAYRVESIDSYRGTPANADDTESQHIEVPSFPTAQDLRRTRQALGLSLTDVAEELDVYAHSVGRWERGESNISLEQAKRYARVLRQLQFEGE